MEKRIDKIIKKAECIKSYLLKINRDEGNIDGLIRSLKSYRDNIGDIPSEKLFIFTTNKTKMFNMKDYPLSLKEAFDWKSVSVCNEVFYVSIKLIEFTSYISRKILSRNYGVDDYCREVLYSVPPMVLEEHISDAVFDVQSFKVDTGLMTELVRAGFEPTKQTVSFVCDFE